MQKDIETRTQQLNIATSYNVTKGVHGQKNTNLCVSITSMTMIRSALKRYLVEYINLSPVQVQQLESDLEDWNGFLSFKKMIRIFTGCVSVRSLEGLVRNSLLSDKFIARQTQSLNNAILRLCCRTIAQGEPGWKMIGPLVDLAKKYGADPTKMKLEWNGFELRKVDLNFFKRGSV